MAASDSNTEAPKISITVEFTGGLEMLFSDQKRHSLTLPASMPDDQDAGEGDGQTANSKPVTIAHLIDHLCRHTMKDSRKELFVLDDHLRPGILCLINDADWELEGEEAYELQDRDSILFVSTLHGG